jgi:glutathione S-transferase
MSALGANYPRGYVPVLEMDDGALLREGSAIVQFLADLVPQARRCAAT